MAVIHWLNSVNGAFITASNWSGGVVPGEHDDAILDAAGADFTVTTPYQSDVFVRTIQTASNATLEINNGYFVADAGTGALKAHGANAGTIAIVGQYSGLSITGTFTNIGFIYVNGGSLNMNGNASFFGGGTIVMTGGAISSNGAMCTNTDNLIEGYGYLNLNADFIAVTMINGRKGVIDANDPTSALRIGACGTILNSGLMEGTGAGGLDISDTVIDNSDSGTILATRGSVVELDDATIVGGVLRTRGGGVITTTNTGFSTLDGTGLSVSNQGRLTVNDGQALSVEGSIVNSGRINLDGAGDPTLLRIMGNGVGSGVTLSGGGVIEMKSRFAEITGFYANTTLDNIDNTIEGAGRLGDGNLNLINYGTIAATGSARLVIDTGPNTIFLAGTIASDSAGGVVVDGAVAGASGVLEANAGTLTLNGSVFGAGSALITRGTLYCAASEFTFSVAFNGAGGALELAHSQNFGSAVSGFSKIGKNSLDLRDIGFVNADEATYSGDAANGVLAVTGGANTARISFVGNYLGATFTASSDGQGGTIVVATMGAARASPHSMVAAMAAMSGAAGPSTCVGGFGYQHETACLSRPRANLA